MKKIIILLFIFISVFLNTKSVRAWDSTIAKYMPLQVGNVWVYSSSHISPYGQGSGYNRYRITGTQLINEKLYYIISHTYIRISGSTGCSSKLFSGDLPVRIDSVSLNIYRSTNCGLFPEALVDSLASRFGDTVFTCYYFQGSGTVLNDTSEFSIFNTYMKAKKFSTVGLDGGYDQTYVLGIGMAKYYYSIQNEICNYFLKGCIINGEIFGDTSMIIGINPISTEIPEKFELSQNYPNPFNPVTKIRFSIPNAVILSGAKNPDIKLVIYDALGKEIQTLVNQTLSPGTYEVDWDASAYPSGVYYYMIKAGDSSTGSGQVFKETKKMVLIK